MREREREREREIFIRSSKNKTKGIWQVINKEIGKISSNNSNIQLRNNKEVVTDPKIITEKFNSYFINIVNDFLNKNSSIRTQQTFQHDTKTCPRSMFAPPVTENEIEKVINKLKGKFSAGFDEIPEFLVKRCTHHIKKPLTHICNISLKFGIFPDLMKSQKLDLFLRRVIDKTFRTTDLLLLFQFFKEYWKRLCILGYFPF